MRGIRYASVQDADIAYQISGDGPPDLLFIPGMLNHLESTASVVELRNHHEQLARFARVIAYDQSGTGLSTALAAVGPPTIEQRVDEALAVLDAASASSACVYATADGGPVAIMLAATHPERVERLALYGTSARMLAAPAYLEGTPPEQASSQVLDEAFSHWGDDDNPSSVDLILPSQAANPRVRAAVAAMQRLTGTPRAARRYFEITLESDVRDALPMVHAPTLVVHVRGDGLFPLAQGRYLADHIPGARLVEVDGDDHYYFWENAERIADELEQFFTGRQEPREPERAFATVLFTDIVDSTRRAADIGDRQWRGLLEQHDEHVAHRVAAYGGRVVKTTGDGALATFDGPSRAVRCATALVETLDDIGIDVRAGLHAGEVETRGDDIAGIAVHIAARVCGIAGPQQVLCTSTLRDLTVGSDLTFSDHGRHELRGVPGDWLLLEIDTGSRAARRQTAH